MRNMNKKIVIAAGAFAIVAVAVLSIGNIEQSVHNSALKSQLSESNHRLGAANKLSTANWNSYQKATNELENNKAAVAQAQDDEAAAKTAQAKADADEKKAQSDQAKANSDESKAQSDQAAANSSQPWYQAQVDQCLNSGSDDNTAMVEDSTLTGQTVDCSSFNF